MATPQIQSQIRSLYRKFLRELPSPSSALLSPSTRTPIHQSLRSDFQSLQASQSSNQPPDINFVAQIQSAEQFLVYLRAQRTYTSLIERYNPGMGMDDEERVRLSARRIGVELPKEYDGKK